MIDPNAKESHRIGLFGIIKLVLIFLVSILMIMGILWVAKVINQQTFIEYAIKFSAVGAIIIIAGGLLFLLGGSKK